MTEYYAKRKSIVVPKELSRKEEKDYIKGQLSILKSELSNEDLEIVVTSEVRFFERINFGGDTNSRR